jgi:hypothetical protein
VFTLYNPTTCKNLDECVEKITIIIDIIHSFILNPNTMIEYDFSKSAKTNNKYDIQKYKIYKSFLEDYNITFNDNDFKHSLYIKYLFKCFLLSLHFIYFYLFFDT